MGVSKRGEMVLLFGATGDLTKRKLIPGLFALFERGVINQRSPIVAIGRRDMTKDQFIKHLDLKRFLPGADKKQLKKFLQNVFYRKLSFLKPDVQSFAREIAQIQARSGCGYNKVYYLALPERLFQMATGVIKRLKDARGWNRVVFEKPFGHDFASAYELNRHVHRAFSEKEVYRIDHYLGKQLVQNIFTFRFSNSIFEQIWNCTFVDHVQIIVHERLGVEERASYYDRSGALLDMVQNHLLQVLALVAMEQPKSLDADVIRTRKAQVLRSLRPVKRKDLVLGQYTAGTIGRKKVPAYIHEKGVSGRSKTETFAALKTWVATPRWSGVPFYLRTGKRLDGRYAVVHIVLKDVASKLFPKSELSDRPNVISVRVQPDEGIAIHFNVKTPGSDMEIEPVMMDFCYPCRFGPNTPKAYDHLLEEVLKGDQSLFTRWDGVAASWKFIDKIKALRAPIITYPAGVFGPQEADLLMTRKGRRWLQ